MLKSRDVLHHQGHKGEVVTIQADVGELGEVDLLTTHLASLDCLIIEGVDLVVVELNCGEGGHPKDRDWDSLEEGILDPEGLQRLEEADVFWY